ncbi:MULTISPECIES: hypothetical protein [unclassified Mesorhizobium]|uniref:hypothetical protein n=1 Tax=unclassified Mesorhizobium TaxID=325217 RepID=UPI00112DA547|nr:MULTISPECIES: hypothetical protein [unclassified Mesorhizobium]MBZ9982548.1 hypothetical protein [Mesorhizobium sp. BR-1-1-8]TPL26912.1 hypothetical protein FJ947_29660 [Mesorhizobium sp. B2-4-8]TPL59284.1 hypothetical protein FJ949_27695 [Mesorhizobium sp. B2-4-1]
MGDDLTLRTLAEIAYFSHQGGGETNAVSATIGAELQRGAWIGSLAAAVHNHLGSDAGTDTLFTTSLGREFEFEPTGAFRVDVAYARSRTDGEAGNTFGLSLHKDLAWSSSTD